ncbi:Single-stranded DNA-binding protein 3 [Willisornis vidua]|uniref:Single-stranded DNA-binding protein 3 n=1 Tax=Willisornis vidua TaxID=1566151 RepID=A0ABQ9DK69_9PASS|nr:Single-stranded DNA-binding protein 3 [Willisornis vidua]
MFAKGKGSAVPSDGQAREKLALYVYEYLLHVGAQKSAQTFLSEIRWEKNITLGEPPGFLHSWWCVFWDLYCAAPERRDTCEHSSEAKAFHDYLPGQAAGTVLTVETDQPFLPLPAAQQQDQGISEQHLAMGDADGEAAVVKPKPKINQNQFVLSSGASSQVACTGGSSMNSGVPQPFMSPRYAGGPRPPIRMGNQPPGAVPGTQPLLPNSMDPTRQQGHPNMGGPMQRMNPPRGMGPMGPGPQNYGSGMRPPPNSLGPGMPGINISHTLLHRLVHMWVHLVVVVPQGHPSCPVLQFPMGPGSDGPMGGMGGMEPHHMNGSLGSGDIDGLPKNSPNNISGISNPPGTPRDDGELGGNFLHSFQNDNVIFPQHDDECVISLPLLLSRIKRVSCRSEDLNELCKKKKKNLGRLEEWNANVAMEAGSPCSSSVGEELGPVTCCWSPALLGGNGGRVQEDAFDDFSNPNPEVSL